MAFTVNQGTEELKSFWQSTQMGIRNKFSLHIHYCNQLSKTRRRDWLWRQGST